MLIFIVYSIIVLILIYIFFLAQKAIITGIKAKKNKN